VTGCLSTVFESSNLGNETEFPEFEISSNFNVLRQSLFRGSPTRIPSHALDLISSFRLSRTILSRPFRRQRWRPFWFWSWRGGNEVLVEGSQRPVPRGSQKFQFLRCPQHDDDYRAVQIITITHQRRLLETRAWICNCIHRPRLGSYHHLRGACRPVSAMVPCWAASQCIFRDSSRLCLLYLQCTYCTVR
jgi:hypothetical protein